MNKNCYSFNQISLNSQNYLNNSIDCTYIIYLKNNGRYDNIINQLIFFQPTSRTYILINDGYKKCYKKDITSSNLDLIDCYLTIFKHANLNNFGNILILEDDFVFSKDIKDINVCNSINNYINNNKSEYVYMLGCLPTMCIGFGKHKKVLISLGTHSVIYSASFVKNHNKDSIKYNDWDYYLRKYNRLMYYEPLCYQLFLYTDNNANWTPGLGTSIIKFLIKKYKLDQEFEGYKDFYFFSSISLYILIFIIFALILLIYKVRIHHKKFIYNF